MFGAKSAPAAGADAILAGLHRLGLVGEGEAPALIALEGGVASDIYLVERQGASPFCVKRALPRLKTAQEWLAPVERNHAEAEWLRTAAAILPDAVPELLGEDRDRGMFAMTYLPPDEYPVWKALLRDGRASLDFAARVGDSLAAIHGATAHDEALAARFATDAIFLAIRLEPYLLAAARAHPGLAPALDELSAATARRRTCLVHGDVSPKNILAGPRGPVFLDAECAWYGDPAFDAAFCLNHLLLKCLWRPALARTYLAMFDAFAEHYLAAATWEPRDLLERRIAALLPGLMLARIDGKSPVEYVTEEALRQLVRGFAATFLGAPTAKLAAIRAAWAREVAA